MTCEKFVYFMDRFYVLVMLLSFQCAVGIMFILQPKVFRLFYFSTATRLEKKEKQWQHALCLTFSNYVAFIIGISWRTEKVFILFAFFQPLKKRGKKIVFSSPAKNHNENLFEFMLPP